MLRYLPALLTVLVLATTDANSDGGRGIFRDETKEVFNFFDGKGMEDVRINHDEGMPKSGTLANSFQLELEDMLNDAYLENMFHFMHSFTLMMLYYVVVCVVAFTGIASLIESNSDSSATNDNDQNDEEENDTMWYSYMH